ncbi:interferon-induced very large GTPase 1 isoform X2 [Oreochromis niloticus]|nr:interferon-induced very large GTPase 1 isoform X2 [Oreochromis niloticus]XP_019212139.1 interferon-induced very large GTPase 1 isoform X2 [Oreochromis niloticus]
MKPPKNFSKRIHVESDTPTSSISPLPTKQEKTVSSRIFKWNENIKQHQKMPAKDSPETSSSVSKLPTRGQRSSNKLKPRQRSQSGNSEDSNHNTSTETDVKAPESITANERDSEDTFKFKSEGEECIIKHTDETKVKEKEIGTSTATEDISNIQRLQNSDAVITKSVPDTGAEVQSSCEIDKAIPSQVTDGGQAENLSAIQNKNTTREPKSPSLKTLKLTGNVKLGLIQDKNAAPRTRDTKQAPEDETDMPSKPAEGDSVQREIRGRIPANKINAFTSKQEINSSSIPTKLISKDDSDQSKPANTEQQKDLSREDQFTNERDTSLTLNRALAKDVEVEEKSKEEGGRKPAERLGIQTEAVTVCELSKNVENQLHKEALLLAGGSEGKGSKPNETLSDTAVESTESQNGCKEVLKGITTERAITNSEKSAHLSSEDRGLSAESKEETQTGVTNALKEQTREEQAILHETTKQQPGSLDEDMSGNMSVKVSDELTKNPCQRQTERLINRLYLQDKLQQKFSPEDFLQIRPPVTRHHVTSEKHLAHTFVRRLMMLDCRARYMPVRPDSPEGTEPKPRLVPDITEKHYSDWEVFLNASVDTEQTCVHPMDVQMAVFHCSDSFLKQMMVTKLSQCQYALPLLVPDPVTVEMECPLWTFRQITKTWTVTQIKDGSPIITMNVPVCKAQTPLVSFFRLGSLSVSKSQLMNTLINDRHSTFFHRNCPGSTRSRHLMDGVAEIAWYCPAGKPTDAFRDCIAFCNLHGDALLTEKQRDILIEKSSINVFLVASLQKDEESRSLIAALFKSHKPLICVSVDDSCDAVRTKKGKYKMGLKGRNQSDVSEELKKIIREVLSSLEVSSVKPSFQLETLAELSGVRVDESDPACQRGRSAALEIMQLITKDNLDISKIKEEFLPYQNHLWHQWIKIHKELNHLRGNSEKKKSEKQQKLMDTRQKQRAASCSKLMELFINNLSALPPTDREYFLKWTQIFMDALSTENVSSVLQSYDEKWLEVLALKNKHDKSGLLLMKQTEHQDLSQKLQSASFGLEHMFREMGHIYEAHRTTDRESRDADWCRYPELAAQLMMSGHPVELMDGDAGHLPFTWISSLLEEVIQKLGDQRVFVLSVLGLQSSGKSSLLSSMFGLQPAVGAGRSTKGAFMQLLKVSENMKTDFDYVLVVDTEGLQAPELDGNTTCYRDNELVTFVVGLGNLTLISIFGDDLLKIQGVLQIVVQALMRMKKVQLSPRCVFVQDVPDVAAAEKNVHAKRRLQEHLDQMTKLAAKEELCDAERFSDVIEFDVQEDVKYCGQLWEGSPPMAALNPAYSESLQEVKNTILSKASKSAGITLSQLRTKVQDLWNALLSENFVFSVKNTCICNYIKKNIKVPKIIFKKLYNYRIIYNKKYIFKL